MKNLPAWLVILCTTLSAYLAPANALASRTQPLDHIVAVVNEDVILKSELETYLQSIVRQLRAQKTAMPEMPVLIKQGLDRLVIQSLQLQRAKRTGIQVDDATLNRSIQGIARKNGMGLLAFRNALQADNIDYEGFREDIRKEIIISRLQNRDVVNRISVSKQEIDDYLLREKKQGGTKKLVRFSHILVRLPDGATSEQIQTAKDKVSKVKQILVDGADFAKTAISFSDGQKALEGGAYSFRPVTQVPPLFSKVLGSLQQGQTSDVFRSPYGFHILKLNEIKGQDKHIISQTRLRHILIRTSALVSSEDAQTRLQQLHTRIVGGDDFATLARSHSDDTLSAKEGGNLGWVSLGDTVPAFEQAYLGLDKGQISEPIKTRYGWHIIQVLDRRQHDDTEQYRRTKAVSNIKKQKTTEELQAWLRKLRDEAYVEYRLDKQQ